MLFLADSLKNRQIIVPLSPLFNRRFLLKDPTGKEEAPIGGRGFLGFLLGGTGMGLGGRETPSDALFVAPVAAVEIIKNEQFSVLLGARLIPLSSTVTFQQHSHFLIRIA